MKQEITRRSFLEGAAAGTVGTAALAMLAGLHTTNAYAQEDSQALFLAGEYQSTQDTPFATIDVVCTIDENGLNDVSYAQISTSQADYFPIFEGPLQEYCQKVVESKNIEEVDTVSGATLCTTAIKDGIVDCMLQALQINKPLPTPLNPQVNDYSSFDGTCSNVLSPIALGTLELPNRIIKSAGSTPWADSNGDSIPVGAELYGAMAANGVSLVILAGGAGLRPAGIVPEAIEVEGDVNEALSTIAPVVEAVHQNGGKIGFQMCFGGGAPTVPDEVINETTVEEFDAFIETVGVSAERAKLAGFDCVEIKGASADALNGFLSRRVNRREDDYGPQSIENRTRLFRRMIEKVKEVNGADFPVGALINGVEENDATIGANDLFITIEESQQIAKALVEAGADWIQVRVGATGQEMNIWAPDVQHIVRDADGLTGYGNQFDYAKHFEGLVDGSRSGFASFLPIVRKIKEVVDVPVGCAAYMDLRVGPDYLDATIAQGDLDLIFMNRPLNCDPELVAKISEGRREDVTPCMKCMHCHDRVGADGRVPSSCRMNASSFNSLTEVMPEGRTPVPAEEPRRIMVVGAGPAGLETARIAAERGHSVQLYDASSRIGGLTNFARGVKGDHEHFDDFIVYYTQQMNNLGIEVNLGTTVDASLVSEVNPDAIVVAVGGSREVNFDGIENVYRPESAFGTARLGNEVVILGAAVQAVDFAAYLVTQGKKVTLVNPYTETDIDKGQSGWFRHYILPYLYSNGTKIWNNAEVVNVASDSVTILTDAGAEKAIPCDSVVEFYDMLPNTALADELAAAGFEVHCVGDCAEPYNIQRAITTGNLCARTL